MATGFPSEVVTSPKLDTLVVIGRRFGLGRVKEELAELDETREPVAERSFGGGRSIEHQEEMSDEDVAEIFNTLRESISS